MTNLAAFFAGVALIAGALSLMIGGHALAVAFRFVVGLSLGVVAIVAAIVAAIVIAIGNIHPRAYGPGGLGGSFTPGDDPHHTIILAGVALAVVAFLKLTARPRRPVPRLSMSGPPMLTPLRMIATPGSKSPGAEGSELVTVDSMALSAAGDAIAGLQTLGFSKADAAAMVASVPPGHDPGAHADTAALIKAALRFRRKRG